MDKKELEKQKRVIYNSKMDSVKEVIMLEQK